MKVLLLILASIFILGPLVVWGILSGMSCAYVTSDTECTVRWSSFLDIELLSFAAIPWGIGLICLLAIRLRT